MREISFGFGRFSSSAGRWLAAVVLGLAMGSGWGLTSLPGQTPAQGKKDEEEATTKKPRKAPPKVGDEEPEATVPRSRVKDRTAKSTDLADEARQTKNPVLQPLLKSLARPMDVVTTPSLKRWLVEPVAEYFPGKPNFSGKREFQPYTDLGEKGKPFSLGARDVASIEPFEQIALARVDEFLKSGLDREPESSPKYLSRLDMLQEAEKILQSVISFHLSAWEQGRRRGEGWAPVKERLFERLKAVQIDQLRGLSEAKDWDGAFALASELAEKYSGQKPVLIEIARLLAAHAENAAATANFVEARKRLRVLESQFPDSPDLEPIRQRLRKQAESLLEVARKLEAEGKTQEAMHQLKVVESVYPQLPGLRDVYARLYRHNPTLYVGVRELPENLSPANAATDAEKQAVELMFESLVKVAHGIGGEHYEPCLAVDLPQLVPLGRAFELVHNARWSTGRQVTAADVRRTVQLLANAGGEGRQPEWAGILEEARTGGDAFHLTLTLRQGYFDPLSLMTFKILPQFKLTGDGASEKEAALQRPEDPEFAHRPIGSGPYRYAGREGEFAVFSANPYYEARQARATPAQLREIRLFHSKDPRRDFQDGRLQLLLDLPTRTFKELSTAGIQDLELRTVPNRRICFLAVNHRLPKLKNAALRQALARGLDRNAILDACFREGLTPPPHRMLYGPYPPDAWACKRALGPDLFNTGRAKAQAEKARKEVGSDGRVALTLKFPSGDPAVAKACELIREQLTALDSRLELTLAPRSPRELRHEVENLHDYELAYYSWDYASEAYWLWPLLDPSAVGSGGRNFLGYQNDDQLESLFRRIMAHRQFAVIEELTHQINDRFDEQMPFIPLWQLDSHLALHRSLKLPGEIDPLLVFTDVASWRVERP